MSADTVRAVSLKRALPPGEEYYRQDGVRITHDPYAPGVLRPCPARRLSLYLTRCRSRRHSGEVRNAWPDRQ